MDLQIQKLNEEQQQLRDHNQQLRKRAEKFGSPFTPLNFDEYRKYKIKKASQTGKIAYLEDVLLDDIKDKEQRKRMIQERKDKFFPEIKVSQAGNFDVKVDIDFTQDDTIIRDNVWHLHGVDYMSNQKIRNYFRGNPHFKIQWLNDSSCNIAFNTIQQAALAIKPLVRGTAQKNEYAQTWYELQDYEVDGIKRQLVCRLATNKDVKNAQRTGRDSEYYKWILNKKKFHRFIKDAAHKEIRKTKAIQKDVERRVKQQTRPKKQEQSSSSGVDESESSESQIAQKTD